MNPYQFGPESPKPCRHAVLIAALLASLAWSGCGYEQVSKEQLTASEQAIDTALRDPHIPVHRILMAELEAEEARTLFGVHLWPNVHARMAEIAKDEQAGMWFGVQIWPNVRGWEMKARACCQALGGHSIREDLGSPED